jgi:hypothetical protein
LRKKFIWIAVGPTFEDQVAQRAIVMVLEAVCEQDFLPDLLPERVRGWHPRFSRSREKAEHKKLIGAAHSRKTARSEDILASVHAMERILVIFANARRGAPDLG